MALRSKTILGEEDSAFARSLFKAMGYTDSELKEGKPLIGIANTWNTVVPGHYNLDKVAEYVKNGIYAGGGTPVEFGTIAACDGVAQGHEGMHYILPSREVICNSVEIMAQAHRLDGLVLLASCDKIVPAMLMAAARLDIPCIVCVGGPMLGGIEFDGRKSDLTSISEALGMLKAGKITECEYNSLENTACPGCGSCSGMFTANSMNCLTEVLGLGLPGNGTIPAVYGERIRLAKTAGMQVMKLLEDNICPRDIVTEKSFENALTADMALGCSTNSALHLPAIAHEAGISINLHMINEISERLTTQGSTSQTITSLAGDITFYHTSFLSSSSAGLIQTWHLMLITCQTKELPKSVDHPYNTLTQQERRIVYYLASGKKNEQIAEELHISIYTVRTHIANIYKKFEVNNKVDLLMHLQPILKEQAKPQ